LPTSPQVKVLYHAMLFYPEVLCRSLPCRHGLCRREKPGCILISGRRGRCCPCI